MMLRYLLVGVILLPGVGKADIALLLPNDVRAVVFRYDDGLLYYRICMGRPPLSGVDRNCPSEMTAPGSPKDYQAFVRKMYSLYGVPNRFNYHPGAVDEVSNRIEELSRSRQHEKLDFDERFRTEEEQSLAQTALNRMRQVEKDVLDHLDPAPLSESFDLHRHKTGHRIVTALGINPVHFEEDEQLVWMFVANEPHSLQFECPWPWLNYVGELSRQRQNKILSAMKVAKPVIERHLCRMELPQ